MCWWCCVDGVVLTMCCWWWWDDGVVSMMCCRWRRARRRTLADPYEGAPSAAPATQKELECSKYCACAAKRCGAQSHHSSPGFRWPLWRCSNGCACHAKRTWSAPSAAPATQNKPEVLQVPRLPRKTTRRPKSSLGAWLPLTSMKVLQRKTNLRCCACHAKQAGGAPSAAPATQNDAAPKVITRRLTSADLYEGAPRQNEPKVLRLPRKTSRRCSKCCACHAKRRGAQSHHSSLDFRWPLWRCSDAKRT